MPLESVCYAVGWHDLSSSRLLGALEVTATRASDLGATRLVSYLHPSGPGCFCPALLAKVPGKQRVTLRIKSKVTG